MMLILAFYNCVESQAETATSIPIDTHIADSLKAATINKEAEDPNFVHAYILAVTPGKVFYSTYGHMAIRMICPSKNLDYCFTFEMDMTESSKTDILTRTAKAGFFMKPTPMFLDSYRKEGRGITAYELNITPKEKQELWRFLDKSVANGSNWTFDYITVNCLTMALYAVNTAILPEKVEFTHLPDATRYSFSEWQDEVSRNSPWVKLLMHTVLLSADGEKMSTEDKLTPGMLKDVAPQAYITDSLGGNKRCLFKGKPTLLLPEVYHDKPCWFRPWMALILQVLVITSGFAWARKKRLIKQKNRMKER